MKFFECTAYFHDGSLLGIIDNETGINFFLESAEVDPSSFLHTFQLSKENTLQGILHLKGIKKILVDGQSIKRPLNMKYPDGEILNLDIQGETLFLLIEWKNSPPRGQANDVSKIEIKAEKIYWENKLFDSFKVEKDDEYLDANNRPVKRGQHNSRLYPEE
ncbi:MAG: hypothetical protein KDK64_05695 [Chlamydiia bacterium]|nr:hypothetical protein [Chlamydiia bacterium]